MPKLNQCDHEYIPEYTCDFCSDPCQVTEETFDYSGTHCNNGIGGIHHTGDYSSDCCSESYTEKS